MKKIEEILEKISKITAEIITTDDRSRLPTLEKEQNKLLGEYKDLLNEQTKTTQTQTQEAICSLEMIGKQIQEYQDYIVQLEEMRKWDKSYVELLRDRLVEMTEHTKELVPILEQHIPNNKDIKSWITKIGNAIDDFIKRHNDLTGEGKTIH